MYIYAYMYLYVGVPVCVCVCVCVCVSLKKLQLFSPFFFNFFCLGTSEGIRYQLHLNIIAQEELG